MNEDQQSSTDALELEFMEEERGNGSLSPHVVGENEDVSKNRSNGEPSYVGYDVRPEDLDALYFEGLGVLRWENIKAENTERQKAVYLETYQKITADYPLISRTNDVDQKVVYSAGEITALLEECSRALAGTTHPKAVRALRKLELIAEKAAGQNSGLLLLPN